MWHVACVNVQIFVMVLHLEAQSTWLNVRVGSMKKPSNHQSLFMGDLAEDVLKFFEFGVSCLGF